MKFTIRVEGLTDLINRENLDEFTTIEGLNKNLINRENLDEFTTIEGLNKEG
jgi:hypothetical protein